MNISENVRPFLEDRAAWSLYRNRSYAVQIRLADPQRVYNVPGQKGVVYNVLEDAYEPVTAAQCIVTGLLGEMWAIPRTVLPKYQIAPDALTYEPQPTVTVETDEVYIGVRIPAEIPFTLTVHYGEAALLHGNRSGVPHGGGDIILFPAVQDAAGNWQPDAGDSGRIVNGSIFMQLYQPYRAAE